MFEVSIKNYPDKAYFFTQQISNIMKTIMSLLLTCFFIQTTIQSQPVYPGDFNMDSRVNVRDVLYLGLAYGETGPARPNATLNWTPQTASNWKSSVRVINNKYQDGNGDGLIDTFDLEAIELNYDLTHTDKIDDGPDEMLEVDIKSYGEIIGSTLHHSYYLILGKSKLGTGHGLSFTVDYSGINSVVDIGIDTISSALLPDIQFVINDAATKTLHVALTAIDGIDRILNVEDTLCRIFICDDIAGLTAPDDYFSKIAMRDIEMMNTAETRYFKDNIELDWTPDARTVPLCRMLWDGELCQYRYGTINYQEQYSEYGHCFEGRFDDNDVCSIGMGCRLLDNDTLLLEYESLCFYIKTDALGIGQSISFYIDNHSPINIDNWSIESLNTSYQKVCIPVGELGGTSIGTIEWLNFQRNTADDFIIYVDDIHAVSADTTQDELILWNGMEESYSRNSTINGEEALNGNYCFEAWHDDWGVAPSLKFSGKAWRQDLTLSDCLVFYAKADTPNRQFGVGIHDLWCATPIEAVNVLDYIEGGVLDTIYRKVSIPINMFQTPMCPLNAIERIYFPVDTPDFRFYIDDIHVVSEDSPDEALGLCVMNCYQVTPTDDDLSEEYFYSIGPNPLKTGQTINITVEETIKADIQLTDITGRVHYRKNQYLYEGNNQLDISTDLPPGMYFLTIYDIKNSQFNTQKLLITNR